MNLEQLASFVEVADTGHFTKAAATLHLAQPSLSRQISTLEKELGAELFHRARGHITLTAAGEALLPTARRMLADAEAIRLDMDELAGLRQGRVRLGATPTLCVSLVAEALSRFHAEHPGIELEVMEKGSRELVEALGAGQLDLALITRTFDLGAIAPRLHMQEVLREDLVVIAAADAPEAADAPGTADTGSASAPALGDTITLAEVARRPQVVFHHGYDLREATSAAFEAAGLTPDVVVAGVEMDAAIRFVERGLGIAIVPAMVLVDRPRLRSVRLVDPGLSRAVSLAQRADVRPTTAASAMERTVLSTARALASAESELSRYVRLEG
ncbi:MULTISPECIES: LysR family transcriptional regulator [Brevibacterium]|uniref:Cyn operon transcriptional activator n=2 Tax=Brevibacterium casei TaxID=33889 RepID=A0A165DPY4_9MICO|nr:MULTISPECIES: LysR family transcriptional regulator [Brevibacterium]KZE17194.1 LysR family transcriptional regulator [Brevibacterium casei]MBE4696032.1 LysR family transcriptional regulator [Brevibacterium casei]MBY3579154.1 LysR family transcriptional regulator [Brevibacterium casei]MCM1012888.1 LysR family transcriptional regulator [Brevibacterium sp. XM4083]MCT1446378.1 LysR family transcriptional regulator [Brevibacterium casei]